MKKLIYLLLPGLIISCASHKEINISQNFFENPIGIYFLSPDTLSRTEITKIMKNELPGFLQVDSVPNSLTRDAYMVEFEKPREDNVPPDVELLGILGKDLSTDEKVALQSYKSVAVITFMGTSGDIFNKQRKISRCIDRLIKNKQVIVFDFRASEWFNETSWVANRIANMNENVKDVSGQVTIQMYRTEGYCRAVTMGMNKFCLPDISLDEFPCSHQNTYGNLINSLIQTLAENPIIEEDSTVTIDLKKLKNARFLKKLSSSLKDNAKQMVRIKLKRVAPQEGDNANQQFQISFDNKSFSSPQEEQEHVINELFGSTDSIAYVKHDELVLKKSEEARKRLPELRDMLHKGLEPGYSILVKAPFKITDESNEWMWVEVTKWNGDDITGILQNDPYDVKGLKAGSIVSVHQKDIFDYILNKPDGSYEGNETQEFLNPK